MQIRLEGDLDDYNRRLDEGPWIPVPKTNRKISNIAERVAQVMARRRKERIDRHISKLADKMGNLNIDDSDDDDPMDTSNLIDGNIVLEDGNGNEYIVHATRSVKKK